jgi:hypothetical protein
VEETAPKRLIASGSYDPDTLKVLFEAFDNAWEQIAPTVGNHTEAVEAAQIKLANIIMALVTYGKPMDTDTLTQDAVELMSEPPEL